MLKYYDTDKLFRMRFGFDYWFVYRLSYKRTRIIGKSLVDFKIKVVANNLWFHYEIYDYLKQNVC